jgi:glycosyltransferase involved in cell wall biosynthesis
MSGRHEPGGAACAWSGGNESWSSASPTVLVGIPAYNEADTIDAVVRDALAVADAVVVVDDGSDDATVPRARDAGAVVVEHDHNRGYGAALGTLFDEAVRRSPDHLVIVDGDGQHDPSDVPRLVDRQRQSGAEIVIGSRFAEGASTNAPLYRRFGLFVINWLVNLSLGRGRHGSRITDTQSGLRAYDPQAIRTLATTEQLGQLMDASIDILYVAASNDFSISEVGVEIRYDVPAANTDHPILHGISLVGTVLRNTFRT